MCLRYTTLKVAAQFGEKLIDKSNCQSFVSDNRHHRFVRRDEKRSGGVVTSKSNYGAIHPIILLFYQRYKVTPPTPPLAFKHWYMQPKTEGWSSLWRCLDPLHAMRVNSCFEIDTSDTSDTSAPNQPSKGAFKRQEFCVLSCTIQKKTSIFSYFFNSVLGIEPNEHQNPCFLGKYSYHTDHSENPERPNSPNVLPMSE